MVARSGEARGGLVRLLTVSWLLLGLVFGTWQQAFHSQKIDPASAAATSIRPPQDPYG